MTKIHRGTLSVALLSVGLGIAEIARAGAGGGLIGKLTEKHDLAPATNERYREECGGCHLAFLPELLSAKDWVDVMESPSQHFGDDLTLAPAVTQELSNYLVANAAKDKNAAHSSPIAAKSGNPPRITETIYCKNRHQEISLGWVKRNSRVGSYANCQACHPDADQGNFAEEELKIPRMTQRED